MEGIEILPFGRFKYPQPYTGSYKGMRFKIIHPKPQEGEEDLIYIDTWPDVYCYEKTEKSQIKSMTFKYSREGYDKIIPYLNGTYEEFYCD